MSEARRCDSCGAYAEKMWVHIERITTGRAYGVTYEWDACSRECAKALIDLAATTGTGTVPRVLPDPLSREFTESP